MAAGGRRGWLQVANSLASNTCNLSSFSGFKLLTCEPMGPPMNEPRDEESIHDTERLAPVRALEQRRIEAIRQNNVQEMADILDDKFIYIDAAGSLYDKEKYLRFVGSHQLTYAMDVELTETDHRIDENLVIIVGQMLGHARLDGEPQVFHLRNMRVWRRHGGIWRLLAWQSSTIIRAPTWASDPPKWPR